MQALKLQKKYERYPEYKDSGVEWLGKIPKGWGIFKAKRFISQLQPGIWGNDPLENSDDIKCLRVADFDFEKLTHKDVETVRNIFSIPTKNILKDGDILIEKSGGGEKQPVGRAVLFSGSEKMTCANFIDVVRLKKNILSKFFVYQLKVAYDSRLNLKSIKQNTGIQNLDLYSYFSEFYPIPSLDEQNRISEYLDENTKIIDEIIDKKQKQIELLQEKRTAVINQAVTRGLDPDVELVDSGVSWIGLIPRGWKVKRIKDVSSYCSRGGTPEYTENEDGFRFINQSCVRDAYLDLEKIKYSATLSKKGIVKTGDILVNSTGTGTLGRSTVFNEKKDFFADTHITIIRPRGMNSFFLAYLIQDPAWQNYLYASAVTGSTNQIELSRNKLLEIPVIVPELEEQEKIISFIDQKVGVIDHFLVKLKESIQVLHEFKSALISNVVTGKIKI